MVGYGHSKHNPSPDDLTIIYHTACHWASPELSVTELRALGIPWYCEHCRRASGVRYVTFHPSERTAAYRAAGIPLMLGTEEIDAIRRKAAKSFGPVQR